VLHLSVAPQACMTDGTKRQKRKLTPIPPENPAARDEGPRLLPLTSSPHTEPSIQHYLDLADRALRGAKKSKPPKRKSP
jgi:hypothetical protein